MCFILMERIFTCPLKMEQDCRLCSRLGINILTSSSAIRRCVDKNCGAKVFYATPKELYRYYSIFLDLTLHEEYYREILYHTKWFRELTEFKKAWKLFTIDIIAGKNREAISIIARYYYYRKKYTISNALYRIDCNEPEETCPICIVNKDSSGNFIFCPRCGNKVCGYCKRRLIDKTCPQCRFTSNGNLDTKLDGLNRIITTRTGEVVKYAYLCLANLYYRNGRISESEMISKRLVADSFWKAIIILARICFTKKEKKKGTDLLHFGIRKSDLACIKEMAYMYESGYLLKKNKNKARYYYSLALEKGDGEVLQHME